MAGGGGEAATKFRGGKRWSGAGSAEVEGVRGEIAVSDGGYEGLAVSGAIPILAAAIPERRDSRTSG